MNIKFSIHLFFVVIALIVTASSSTDTRSSTPIDPAQFTENETVAPIPVTGDPAAEAQRLETEPRLQSGEIFLSDNENPDVQLNNIQTGNQQDLQQTGCMSGDEQPRPHSGCVE